MATIEKQNPSLFSRYRTLDAVAGRKGRLLMALPLQLRKDVAEEHLLPLHQWKKKMENQECWNLGLLLLVTV